jgi:isopropylmalate/homocitrate/citramalate synthase
MTYFIKELKKVTGNTPLEVHCHDDFGLGTANTLAALNGGANVLSTSMNGVGERCGNAATEEVLMALLVFYNIDFGMKYEKLYELSKTVQELTGISPAPYKAIVGENLFKIEFLETITEAEKDPLGSCVGAYIPSLVGQRRQLVLGRNSTEETIRYKLKELGIKVEERDVPAILKRVLETAEEKRTWIRDNEFKAMIAQMRADR